MPARRHLVLGGLLAASAAGVAWDRLAPADGPGVAVAHLPGDASSTPPPAPGRVDAVRSAPPAIPRLHPRDDYRLALAEAASAEAPPAAPPPPPPPAPAAAPAPPPAPAWRVIGKARVDGRWEVYVARADHVDVLRQGDQLDGAYEVASIVPPTLHLVQVGTGQPRDVPIGAAFDP